jgi:pSer/pThr/pTyr-binding forkhead associated (FHA) protein
MPRLIVQCDDRVLKHCVVEAAATIGRLPDNTIVIDNPAVSGHHACVLRDGDRFVVEDLASTNGTFLNGARVTRQPLADGDVVRVGQHTLVFDQPPDDKPVHHASAEPVMSNPGETVFLDGGKYQALLAMLKETEACLTGQRESALEARTAAAARPDTALMRLHAWFKAIARWPWAASPRSAG